MPPLHKIVNESPTPRRTSSVSALPLVEFAKIASDAVGPEEPVGRCFYAHNRVIVEGEEEIMDCVNDSADKKSAMENTRRRRPPRASTRRQAKMKDQAGVGCGWASCGDNSCNIS
jgi:hypothetical protein